MKYSGIGGQAVIEGIMMKNGTKYAVGICRPDGVIDVKKDEYIGFSDRHAFARLPFIRGVFSFVDSMILGYRTLSYSASFYEEEKDTEPSKLEKFLDRIFGDKLEKILMTGGMVLGFLLALLIFVWLPLTVTELLGRFVTGQTVRALLEGLFRVALFVLYVKLIGRTEDIRRTFMYHGSEHKCINCIEHGLELNVENVRASSKEHRRCGTSFLVIVMMISMLFFVVIRVDGVLMRFVTRILLIPVIAGVSYEFLRLAGRSEGKFINLISRPGMWMQGLTTLEPDDRMIEVAIAATEAVFDWRAFQKENFEQKSAIKQ